MHSSDLRQRFQEAHEAFLAGDYDTALRITGEIQPRLGDDPNLLHLIGVAELRRGKFRAAIDALVKAVEVGGGNPALFRDWALALRSSGDPDKALEVLGRGLRAFPDDRQLLLALGEAERASDRRDSAATTIDRLLARWPGDREGLHVRALIELERGGNARDLFERLLKADPTSGEAVVGAATAMHEAGDSDSAIALLQRAVASDPRWTDGLRALARLRFDRGDGGRFTEDFERAVNARPRDTELWATFLGVLSSALRFDKVLENLPKARAAAGEQLIFAMLEAQALAELGRLDEADAAFSRLDDVRDPTFAPARIRLLLRAKRFAEAAAAGEEASKTHAGPFVWPLLALAWRKSDEGKWRWLERYDDTVGAFDLPLDLGELEELASLLRRLHRSSGHPYDQSARGGTQTLGHLLNRSDAPLRRLRQHLSDAVATFIAALPPMDPSHPFLSRGRDGFKFAGSWSIRLRGEGYHVSHVHPQGWISSAFYIALPEVREDDPAREGWLKLGESPPELGLDLPPVRTIMPRPARLVLFPSIMWHGTVPFRDGERLSVAFDVVPRGA